MSESNINENPSNMSNTNTMSTREMQLQNLVFRLLAPQTGPERYQSHLLVGQLPPNLDIAIPFLEGTVTIGTFIQSSENLEIVLDVPNKPEDVSAFYKDQLTKDGWTLLEHFPYHGGFAPSGIRNRDNHVTYCKGSTFPSLHVTVSSKDGIDTLSEVNIQLVSGPHSPCIQQRRQRSNMYGSIQNFFPRLNAPEGAEQRMRQSGGGGDSYQTSATLTTALALPDVIQHYDKQLIAANWQKTDEGQSGVVAWSVWQLQDEDNNAWRGLLFVLKEPGCQQEYYLYLHAARDRGEDDTNRHGTWHYTATTASNGTTAITYGTNNA